RLVNEVWSNPVNGCPMYILAQKLKSLKAAFKSWNIHTFGNVKARVDSCMKEVEAIQQQISLEGYSDDLHNIEIGAQSNLQQALQFEESFWKQKSSINWFTYGDRNTAFFHRMAKIKYASKQMSILRSGDMVIDDPLEIENHVINYYTNLYAVSNNCVDNGLIAKVIPKIVTDEDNMMLTKIPTMEEVKTAVFSMNGSGAPGPDGFGGSFYQSFWNIIATDVYNSVVQFFHSNWIMPGLNSNLVCLVPKFKEADRIEDYRPIALANFQFKIITKVLSDRLSRIAPKIISPQQRGFIQGRHITDCIFSASEAINLLGKKTYGVQLSVLG
ncbi:hypothetical protein L195_g048846, partial [Trifolium pratense]